MMIIRPAGFAEVQPLLALAQERGDHTGGTLSIGEACAGAMTWAVENEAGQVVMAYAMRVGGGVCWVVAAGGEARGVDLVKATMPTIERQARAMGCSQVAVTTCRPGLVRKLRAQGFGQSAVTLRKKLA